MDVAIRMGVLALLTGLAGAASIAFRKYVEKPDLPSRFDRKDVNGVARGAMLVEFTSPYCIECQTALPLLEAAAENHNASLAVIDARERPDLASKYAIRSTPTILVVDDKGRVTTGWKTSPPEIDLSRALASVNS